MNYALENLIEVRKKLYTQQEFLEKHVSDTERALKAYKQDQFWNEKAIKETEEAIRKLE